MKIIHEKDIHKLKSKLSKADIATMAVLKLSGPGEYIKGRGILDNGFYLITENKYDEVYALSKQSLCFIKDEGVIK
tara:strand:- start:1433 stop:1660 length:228 start_codon:yes stop_codon:yes gene_type:complete